jgi:hypothetical protein
MGACPRKLDQCHQELGFSDPAFLIPPSSDYGRITKIIRWRTNTPSDTFPNQDLERLMSQWRRRIAPAKAAGAGRKPATDVSRIREPQSPRR